MFSVGCSLEILVSKCADRDDNVNRTAAAIDVKGISPSLNSSNGVHLRELPPATVRIRSSDIVDALVRAESIRFIYTTNFVRHGRSLP